MLGYKQEEYISYSLRCLAPFCDHVVVMYSEAPWIVSNPMAREHFGTNSTSNGSRTMSAGGSTSGASSETAVAVGFSGRRHRSSLVVLAPADEVLESQAVQPRFFSTPPETTVVIERYVRVRVEIERPQSPVSFGVASIANLPVE